VDIAERSDFDLLIVNAEVGGARVDLRIEGDRIIEIGRALERGSDSPRIDARGGALIPGLHDHHLHLLALAASLESIDCGPPAVTDLDALRRAIAETPDGGGTLRGTNYFESVAGPLDRDLLDRLCPDRPLRIQHRSGSMWFLNSLAVDALGFWASGSPSEPPSKPPSDRPEGAEVDATGRLTGRFFRLDEWLREHGPARAEPDLGAVGELLSRHGVTGVTDATPTNGVAEFELLRKAQASRAFPQRVFLMGSAALANQAACDGVSIGPHKILLDEPALPDLDALVERIERAHAHSRPVAVHTVTRSEILFALAALDAAGSRPGDRLEHASIAPTEAIAMAQRLGLTIVTQPNFVAERGDAYLEHVEAGDQASLYRLRSWLRAGVPLAGGTDAPFGRADPWRAMRAAVTRQSACGAVLGAAEALSPEEALALFLTSPEDPGGRPRRLEVGGPADLCLLDRPWHALRQDLDAEHVMATIRAGRVVFAR
jgi:predicted amidohydrolase YtcJ